MTRAFSRHAERPRLFPPPICHPTQKLLGFRVPFLFFSLWEHTGPVTATNRVGAPRKRLELQNSVCASLLSQRRKQDNVKTSRRFLVPSVGLFLLKRTPQAVGTTLSRDVPAFVTSNERTRNDASVRSLSLGMCAQGLARTV